MQGCSFFPETVPRVFLKDSYLHLCSWMLTSTFSDFRPFSLPKYLLNPLPEKRILLILGKLTISYFPSLSSEKRNNK